MKKRKMLFVVRAIAGLLAFCLYGNSMQAQVNQLHRLFHHRVTDTSPVIELGQIVFYFTSAPTINQLKTDQPHEKHFFIGNIKVDKTMDAEIDRFNAMNTKHYKAQLEKTRGGILLRISCNPHTVGLDWGNFVTIKNEAGVGFRLYDNAYLKKLNGRPDVLLKTVSVSKKPRIVIDCGHGGTDVGAIGCDRLMEKEVTLGVGVLLANTLRSMGNEVFLTRDHDVTVALDERTSFANKVEADLLVSIHANSAPNKNTSGVESFCLPDKLCNLLGCSLAGVDQQMVGRLHAFRNNQSLQLARCIQNNIVMTAKKKEINLVDRQVKRAVSQILAGASMPAVLVEIGFLTNDREAYNLKQHDHQQLIAQGMSAGIREYQMLVASMMSNGASGFPKEYALG